MERRVWIVAGVVRATDRAAFFRFLGLVADYSAGVKWMPDRGLLATNFEIHTATPIVAEQVVLGLFHKLAAEAGLPGNTFKVQPIVSPPSPPLVWGPIDPARLSA